jgi:hypothetical protein
MANIRSLQHSFNGGELTPEFFGQVTDQKYSTGAATLLNFMALPHGPAANRPGFEFVRAVKDSSKAVRLIPFVYSTTQTFAIEFGAGYFRFHTAGATVMNSGVPYEITSDYAEADLFDVHYVQSADVMTLVHPSYPPRELRRYGALDWRLVDIDFVPDLAAPTGVTATATVGSGTSSNTVYSYVVTNVDSTGLNESIASSAASCTGDLLLTDSYNTVGWTAVSGAYRYNIYRKYEGLYGYVGQTADVSFIDDNITPDLTQTPPEQDDPFSSADNYPSAVGYFEQRRVFAGTENKPQNVWLTRSGTESNMSYSLPTRDEDSIRFRIAVREASRILHIVPLTNLVALTSATELRISSTDSGALTPSNPSVRPQSYVGANNTQPLVVNNNLLFVAARGGHVRELAYNYYAGGYVTGDISLRAPHLFDGLDVTDCAYQKSPYPICWWVSSNGQLLGLTYVPEQQIGAWHRHDTINGSFESVCCIADGDTEDRIYVVVKRTVNGATVRYIERMSTVLFVDRADAFFVDSGLTYEGTATTSISGLDHLTGETVNILADGAVLPQQTVVSGGITLPVAASKVTVGLPITATIATLPLAQQVDGGMGQGRYKDVNQLWIRVYQSSGLWAGPSLDDLVEAKPRSTEVYGSPPNLKSEEIYIRPGGRWNDSGQIYIQQTDPLPLKVVAITAEVAIGA